MRRILTPKRRIRKFHVVMFALVGLGALCIGLVASQQKASADFCSDNSGLPRTCNRGYFYNQFDPNGKSVYEDGIPGWLRDSGSFIGLVGSKMACTRVGVGSGGVIPGNLYNTQEATGSAFIILTMLGFPAGTNKNVACDQYLRWVDLINQYSATNSIIWDNFTFWRGNTYYQSSARDVASVSPGGATPTQNTDWLITFVTKGRESYNIRRACANPVGRLVPLVDKNQPPEGSITQAECTGQVSGFVRDDDTSNSVLVRIGFSNAQHGEEYRDVLSDYQWNPNPGIMYIFRLAEQDKPAWAANSSSVVNVRMWAQDNPSGVFRELPGKQYGPCLIPQGTCSVGDAVFSPMTPDPNTPFSIRATIHYTNAAQGSTGQTAIEAAKAEADYINTTPGEQGYIRIVTPAGVIRNEAIQSTVWNVGTDSITQSTGILAAPGDTGQFKVYWGVSPGNPGATDCPLNVPGGAILNVVNTPYFNVTGGDVSAGAGMSSPTSGSDCSTGGTGPNPKAGIVSWNKEASGNYAGAGTAYGALALNYLEDFATAQNTASPNANARPDGLSFANVTSAGTPFNVATGMFGGSYGATSCAPNYFDATNAQTGTYQVNPGNTKRLLDKNSSKDTIYVDGNAVISNDVIYTNSGNYANIGEIPNFSLVVRGNIFIDASVGQIDGVLVAQPKADGTGGVIYTCAPNGTSSPVLDKNLYNKCKDKPLVFNGAVIAKQLWLLRTYGSISEAPAEQFNFTPEVWLQTVFTSDSTGKAGDYDAISSLPPVL